MVTSPERAKAMKAFVTLCLAVLGMLVISVPGEPAEQRYRRVEAPRSLRGRAVSLRLLQQGCEAAGGCPTEALRLYGITRLAGYLIDEEHHDLILIGAEDPTRPPLSLDDFVVTMRNTMLRYASHRGNTVIYASPGCSIDPDPKVVQRLQQIGDRIASSREVKEWLQQWQGVCRQPQEVRVMGVPFDSHFAQVMVVADYDMKRLANGSVAVDSEGFSSLTGMRLALARQELEEGRSLSGPLRTLNRFWFSPGDTTFVEDKGIIVFKQVEIKLLTEQEFVSRRGEVKGSGKPDPLAAKFAQSFSTRYADIAKSKPIYAELENLFRFVALARVIRQQEAASEAGISLDYLLSRYPVTRVPVDRTLAGISHVGELEQRQRISGGRRVAHLWAPSCGGVTIDIPMRKNDLIRDSNLRRLKGRVIRERPSAQTVTWGFKGLL